MIAWRSVGNAETTCFMFPWIVLADLPGVYTPVGCDACRGTGFRGRVGLFELLVIDDTCRDLVQTRSNAAQIREAGMQAGMHLLATDGLLKVHQGVTTLDEVMRVTTV